MRRTQIMAHTFAISVRFECAIPRASWGIFDARPKRWLKDPSTNEWEVGLEVDNYPALRHSFGVDSLPRDLASALPSPGERFSSGLSDRSFPVLVGEFHERKRTTQKFNQWDVREAVMSLNEDPEALLALLERFGIWSGSQSPYLDEESGDYDPVIVIPDDVFRERSKLISLIGRNNAAKWFSSYEGPRNFVTRPKYPHYIHLDKSCIDAVRTSVTVDFLRGLGFSTCPRYDCRRKVFVARKGKVFCSQYCAHIDSVRRSRGTPGATPKTAEGPRTSNRRKSRETSK